MDIVSAIIGSLVGAIFGAAIATIGGIVPLSNKLTSLQLSFTERVSRLEQKETDLVVRMDDTVDRIESIKRDGRRRTNALLRALGRRDLMEEEDE